MEDHIPKPEHPEDLVPAEVASAPTPPLLAPSTSHKDDILEADTFPQKRLLLTTPRPSCE
ncbi:hypothetical protein Tco_0611948, partial [Tanacetum coccineum]